MGVTICTRFKNSRKNVCHLWLPRMFSWFACVLMHCLIWNKLLIFGRADLTWKRVPKAVLNNKFIWAHLSSRRNRERIVWQNFLETAIRTWIESLFETCSCFHAFVNSLDKSSYRNTRQSLRKRSSFIMCHYAEIPVLKKDTRTVLLVLTNFVLHYEISI